MIELWRRYKRWRRLGRLRLFVASAGDVDEDIRRSLVGAKNQWKDLVPMGTTWMCGPHAIVPVRDKCEVWRTLRMFEGGEWIRSPQLSRNTALAMTTDFEVIVFLCVPTSGAAVCVLVVMLGMDGGALVRWHLQAIVKRERVPVSEHSNLEWPLVV